MDAMMLEIIRPGRICSQVKGSNLVSASSDELQAETRANMAQPARHDERLSFYPFIFAQVHFR